MNIRKAIISVILVLGATAASAQTLWQLSDSGRGIVLSDPGPGISDHIEMSGQMVSVILRWGISGNGVFQADRRIVFPMLRIRPTGFRSFTVSPRLARGWDRISLRHIRAFDSDFDITVTRTGRRIRITVQDNLAHKTRTYRSKEGETVQIIN